MRLLSVCTFHPQQLHGRSQERGFGTGHFGQFQTPAGRVPPRSELTSSISESSAHLCVFIMTPIHVCRCLPRVQPLAAQVLLHTVSHGGAAAGLLARFFLLREHVAVPPPPPHGGSYPFLSPPGPFCVSVTPAPSFLLLPSQSITLLFFFTTTAMAAPEEVRYGATRRNTWSAPTRWRHLLESCNSREQESAHVQIDEYLVIFVAIFSSLSLCYLFTLYYLTSFWTGNWILTKTGELFDIFFYTFPH